MSLPIFAIFLAACVVHAQTPGTGAIAGTVHDPSGFVVAKAKVVVVNESTNAMRTALTDPAGVFSIPLLSPGSYSVTVTSPGFGANTISAVRVVVSETSSLDLRLAIEKVGVNVEVTSSVEIAQTESSTLGRAVETEAMESLPLANRNYTQILALSPGVVVALPDATALGRNNQNVTSNGAKTTSNNIQFNGVDANNLSQDSAADDGEEVGTAVPAPDAIEEFKVQTANYDASYGRGAGANVDLISKTGTNSFHGSAWEFVRNNIFNANDFFSNLNGQPRPALKQNQFGGAVGGPILKDRTFFFGEYQGTRQVDGYALESTVDLPQLTSDRSAATLGAQFCPANHANGAGYLTNAGGTQVACDGSNINPAALALLNFKLANGQYAVPSPQTDLSSTDPTQLPIGQSTYAPSATFDENQFSMNIDEQMAARNTLSGRFFYARAPSVQPFSPNAANVPGWGTNELEQNTMFVLSDTHVLNSNMVNVARFGYMRFDGVASIEDPIEAAAVGMSTPTGAAGPAPGVSIGGLFTTGDAGTPFQWQVTNSFIWQDTLSLTRNRHNMRFGAEFKRHQVDVDAPFSADGLLQIATFDDFLLGQSAAQNGSPNDESNVTDSQGSSGLFRKNERYNDFAWFAQDDMKLTNRLTVNVGARYEIFGPPMEIHGLLPNFDPSIATEQVPAAGSLSGYTLPANFAGPIPPGVIKTPSNSLWSIDYAAVSPRLGFALQLTQRPVVVLRGGYGIYYDHPSGDFAESTIGQQPLSVQQLAFGALNAAATLQAPFNPLLPSSSSYPIYEPRIAGGGPYTSGVSPHVIDPYTQEYNLNFQVALSKDDLLEVGYVGSHTTHSPGSVEFNQSLLASPQNPVNGTTMNTAANVVQRVPYQGIATGSLFSDTNYEANYNSLQASVTRRWAHGFELLGSYTWSKILDETSGSGGSNVFELWLPTNDQHNPRQAYGLTDFDHDQRAVMSFTWAAPKFQYGPAVARQALSGWEFSGIAVIQAGSPITVMDLNAGLVYGNFENRAQSTGANPSTHGSLYSRVMNGYLTQNSFTTAPEAPFGSGPGDTDFGHSGVGFVRGPGQHNLDMSVERIFPVREAGKVHIRGEFFNLTNTPQFANPNNFLDFTEGPTGPVNLNPAFGAITGRAANPRIVQFAAKYAF
jgi:hypothetical protein